MSESPAHPTTDDWSSPAVSDSVKKVSVGTDIAGLGTLRISSALPLGPTWFVQNLAFITLHLKSKKVL